MSQYAFYPSSSASANPSVGTNGAAIPTSSTLIAGKTPGGLQQPVSVDTSGNQNVNILGQTDNTATGSLAALNATVVLSTVGMSTSIFGISGAWVGTITFEASNDSFTTLVPVAAVYLNALQTQSSQATTNGQYSAITAGFAKVRANMTAYTSGSATITAEASVGNRISVALQGNPNNLQVLATQGAAGASAWKVDGSAVTQPISAATLPLPTGASTEATLAKVPLAQASITSGQSGSLIQGAVTTAAPSYTTAQTNPLSLTTAGALRVDNSAVTQPVSAAALPLPSNASTETTLVKLANAQSSASASQSGPLIQGSVTTAAPTYTTGNTNPLSLTTGGLLRVDASSGATAPSNIAQYGGAATSLGQKTSSSSVPVVLASDQTVFADLFNSGSVTTQNLNPNTGVATASSTVAVTGVNGMSNASVQVTGVYTGALTAQATVDGSNWVALTGILNTATGALTATIASAAVGIFQIDVAGFAQVRITALAAVTGTATVTVRASIGNGTVALDSPLPTGANVIGALSANQSVNAAQINGVTPLMGNGVTGTGSLRVTLASDTTSNTNPLLTKGSGRTLANAPVTPVDYTSTPVTSGAYVQLVASTTSATNLVEIFDSSGQTLFFAVGAAASEVNQFVITPGGNGPVQLSIPAASRLSVKATGTSATVGILVVNLYT